jgi:hypothetical protein
MRCCLKSVLSGMLLGVGLLALLIFGAYLFFHPRLDAALSDAVRREYLLPPSATIKFDHGTMLDTYQGKIERFYVNAKEAKLEGLVISDVELITTGIQFDMTRTLITGEAELKKVDHAQLKFRVAEESLAERWSETLAGRGISDVDVDLGDKVIEVSGKIDLKLATVPVAARGVFEADGSKLIRMKVNELKFGSTKLPLSQFKELFTKSIRTPVLDLGDLQMGVSVRRLEAKNGYLYVEAESETLEELREAMRKEKAAATTNKEHDSEAGDESVGQRLEDSVKDAAKNAVDDIGDKIKDKLR